VQPIVATSVRPHFNTIAISCENCIVYEWNFQEKNNILHVLNDQLKDSEVPTCLNYSPNSKYLAVATKIGTIYMYEVETGIWQSHLDVTEAEKSTPAVTMQVFSPDSKHLATMDEDFGVTLFILKGDNW
jgi:6-phosphogluconolactonase (cycloisomerase 2 family)